MKPLNAALLLALLAPVPRASAQNAALGGLNDMGGFGMIQTVGAYTDKNGDIANRPYPPEDKTQMEEWFLDREKAGANVIWLDAEHRQYGEVFEDGTIGITDGVRRQSLMPRPINAAERRLLTERFESRCAVYGPPPPDCGDLEKLLEKHAPNELAEMRVRIDERDQMNAAENKMWGGNEKGTGDSGDNEIVVTGNGGGGRNPGPSPLPSPGPSPDSSGRSRSHAGGSDAPPAGSDGARRAGGDLSALSSLLSGGGDDAPSAGGGDEGGVVYIDGNKAVAEHTAKYGGGFTYTKIAEASAAAQSLIEGGQSSEAFAPREVQAGADAGLERGRMRISAQDGSRSND